MSEQDPQDRDLHEALGRLAEQIPVRPYETSADLRRGRRALRRRRVAVGSAAAAVLVLLGGVAATVPRLLDSGADDLTAQRPERPELPTAYREDPVGEQDSTAFVETMQQVLDPLGMYLKTGSNTDLTGGGAGSVSFGTRMVWLDPQTGGEGTFTAEVFDARPGRELTCAQVPSYLNGEPMDSPCTRVTDGKDSGLMVRKPGTVFVVVLRPDGSVGVAGFTRYAHGNAPRLERMPVAPSQLVSLAAADALRLEKAGQDLPHVVSPIDLAQALGATFGDDVRLVNPDITFRAARAEYLVDGEPVGRLRFEASPSGALTCPSCVAEAAAQATIRRPEESGGPVVATSSAGGQRFTVTYRPKAGAQGAAADGPDDDELRALLASPELIQGD